MQLLESDDQSLARKRSVTASDSGVITQSHVIVDEGTIIFSEGERGYSAFLIERGEVEISVMRNGEAVKLASRGPGEVFGEMAIIDDQPRSATVTAVRPCQLLMITREQLSHRIEQTDPVLRMCLRVILQRFRSTLLRLQVMDHEELQLSDGRDALDKELGPQVHDEAVREIKLEEELRQALRLDEFTLNYQPIVELAHSRPVGFEALIRWNHRDRGLVPPDVFIPTAESSGLIVPIGYWVFEKACETILRMREAAAFRTLEDRLFMSINLSVRDLADKGCVDKIRDVLSQSGADPSLIKLEITESLLMHQPEVAATALQQFKDMGLSIAIDDFGTGYSSLSYLHKFPIDTLKIDRSFTKGLEQDGETFAIVSSIIHMAHRLNMEIVAEGIEEEAQANLLRELGCTLGQGYLYAKPASEQEATRLLLNAKETD
ncbi:MAG: EAL domain-containing protein [Pseudomonadota bacterium]